MTTIIYITFLCNYEQIPGKIMFFSLEERFRIIAEERLIAKGK